MSINPNDKMINSERMEKWVLRKAFEDYLPESIVWRQKEQFSDGVGYSWIDKLKELVKSSISDDQMKSVEIDPNPVNEDEPKISLDEFFKWKD